MRATSPTWSLSRLCEQTLNSKFRLSKREVYGPPYLTTLAPEKKKRSKNILKPTGDTYRSITTQKLPAPKVSGFMAQLVKASHQYDREITYSGKPR